MGRRAFFDTTGSDTTGVAASELLGALDFAQTSSLAAETAQVEQLGATNLVGADLFDLVDNLRVVGEDALNALTKAHLADGEGALGALARGDDHSFECLEALFFTLFDLYLDADGVTGSEIGEVGPLELRGQLLHDWMYRHSNFPR